MVKDDSFVLVYKLLTYLYETLKAGEKVDPKMICNDTITDFEIPYSYWLWILLELKKMGYIAGVGFSHENKRIKNLEKTHITFEGIEYLSNNATIKKVRQELN